MEEVTGTIQEVGKDEGKVNPSTLPVEDLLDYESIIENSIVVNNNIDQTEDVLNNGLEDYETLNEELAIREERLKEVEENNDVLPVEEVIVAQESLRLLIRKTGFENTSASFNTEDILYDPNYAYSLNIESIKDTIIRMKDAIINVIKMAIQQVKNLLGLYFKKSNVLKVNTYDRLDRAVKDPTVSVSLKEGFLKYFTTNRDRAGEALYLSMYLTIEDVNKLKTSISGLDVMLLNLAKIASNKSNPDIIEDLLKELTSKDYFYSNYTYLEKMVKSAIEKELSSKSKIEKIVAVLPKSDNTVSIMYVIRNELDKLVPLYKDLSIGTVDPTQFDMYKYNRIDKYLPYMDAILETLDEVSKYKDKLDKSGKTLVSILDKYETDSPYVTVCLKLIAKISNTVLRNITAIDKLYTINRNIINTVVKEQKPT